MYVTHRVRILKTYIYRGQKSSSYHVRWRVEKRLFKKTFSTRALAESYRSKLIAAMSNGEAFRTDTGLPVSMERPAQETSWFEFACDYVERKWPGAAATYRRTIAEALIAVTPTMLKAGAGKPSVDDIRRALGYAFNLGKREREDKPVRIASALAWIERNSLPLSSVMRPEVALAVHEAVVSKLDGTPLARSVARQRRMIVSNALNYAVEIGALHKNPIKEIKWSAPKPSRAIDRRRVPNPTQVRELLAAAATVQRSGPMLAACYASMYFAALRPEEAVNLRERHISLPSPQWSTEREAWIYEWGSIYVEEAAPHAGSEWTDTGQPRDRRGLKHRERGEGRQVPCPPELTEWLTEHLRTYGATSDGRLFRGEDGREVPAITWHRVWRKARERGLAERLLDTPMACRPYDLRHAAVSTWLNGGVAPTLVAEWAGHSVEVLLEVYAKCLDGQERIARQQVEAALGPPR